MKRLALIPSTLALLAALLACCSAAAQARAAHVFTSSFGGAGSGPGQLSEPQGVAVSDETGDVYVADKGNNRVEAFNSKGEYQFELNGSGLNVNEGIKKPSTGRFEKPEWIAVDNSCSLQKPALTGAACTSFDPSNGDVYVTDNGHKVIDKVSKTGEYLGQVTGTCENTGETPPSCSGSTPFGALYGVAVDLTGELWVSQAGGEVDNYSDTLANEYLERRPTGASNVPGFAVGPEDDLYVPIECGLAGRVRFYVRHNSAGTQVGAPFGQCGGEQLTAAGATVNLSTNEGYINNVTLVRAFSAAEEDVQLESFGSEQLAPARASR